MEKLNQILKAHVADGQDTKDKLLGASFIVVKADGRAPTTLVTHFMSPMLIVFHRPTLRRSCWPNRPS